MADEVAFFAGEVDEFEAGAEAFAMAEQGTEAERFHAIGQGELDHGSGTERQVGGQQEADAFLVQVVGPAMNGGVALGREANAKVNLVAEDLTIGQRLAVRDEDRVHWWPPAVGEAPSVRDRRRSDRGRRRGAATAE